MSKITKIWLIIAASFVLIGCIIFGGVMMMLKWDFSKLTTSKYETNEYDISENYENISIVTDSADIVFVPSEEAKSSVVCYEQKNVNHSVAVKENSLVIEVKDTRKWYEHIGLFFNAPKITVYLPQSEYGGLSVIGDTGDIEIPKELKFKRINISQSTGDVTNYASCEEDIKIKTSTGDIRLENISAKALDLSVSTGDIEVLDTICEKDICIKVSTGKTDLANIQCKNLASNGSTGNMALKNVIATEKFTIKRSTGDLKLDGCDASEILIKTGTGNVIGSILTDKVFITQTDTGRVSVPKTTTGGKCEITTDTGDIRIKIQ